MDWASFFFITGLTESLFLPHKDIYIEYEQASLRQLYKTKVWTTVFVCVCAHMSFCLLLMQCFWNIPFYSLFSCIYIMQLLFVLHSWRNYMLNVSNHLNQLGQLDAQKELQLLLPTSRYLLLWWQSLCGGMKKPYQGVICLPHRY